MRRRTFLQLGLAVLATAPGCAIAAQPPGGQLSRHRLRHDDPRFGGFSALHLAANGRDCLLMNDRGLFAALRLERDAQGKIASSEVLSLTPMLDPQGKALGPNQRDSEGLAVGPNGALYVSFEGIGGGKIWRYSQAGAKAEVMPFAPHFARLPPNGGFEALAMDERGRLLAMPEDLPDERIPLFRLEGKGWDLVGRMARMGNFKPVALDTGPDGALYLLERAYQPPIGFESRLSRLSLGPKVVREVLWQSRYAQFGNLEGLSMTRTPQGRLRATMVTDNNQLSFLSSELIELILP